jgi:hypothetical protein
MVNFSKKLNRDGREMNRNKRKYFLVGYGVLFLIIFVAFVHSTTANENEEIRSKHEVSLIGKYMGYACGDLTPQITPVKDIPPLLSTERLGLGFSFHVPINFNSPDQIDELRVPGNLFEIKGYYYYTTGKEKYLYHKFDLISWRPIVPFKIWTNQGEIEIVHDSSAYDKYWNTSFDQGIKFKAAGKYIIECE